MNEFSGDRLTETVENAHVTVVMFYEKGDYECQLQSRALNELAREYKKKVLFVKVNVNVEEEFVDLFEVEDTPEIYFLLDGEILFYSDDRLTKSELREGIHDLLQTRR